VLIHVRTDILKPLDRWREHHCVRTFPLTAAHSPVRTASPYPCIYQLCYIIDVRGTFVPKSQFEQMFELVAGYVQYTVRRLGFAQEVRTVSSQTSRGGHCMNMFVRKVSPSHGCPNIRGQVCAGSTKAISFAVARGGGWNKQRQRTRPQSKK
jgi:hypothetical protein